ncbi:MAG: hypothetical protein ACOVQA_08820, partial [Thermoflexibacteraceae bacterium]
MVLPNNSLVKFLYHLAVVLLSARGRKNFIAFAFNVKPTKIVIVELFRIVFLPIVGAVFKPHCIENKLLYIKSFTTRT